MSKQLKWIKTGYTLVATRGISEINVGLLAQEMGSSKSSFYHYFGSLDNFLAELLRFHVEQAEALSIKIQACETLIPDMTHVFVHNGEDILFHKQIRIRRDQPAYRQCFEAAFEKVEDAILDKWIAYLDLAAQPLFARSLLNIIADNFLLRITATTYSYEWLADYTKEMYYLVRQMKNREK